MWITLTDSDAASCFTEWEWASFTETARESGVGDAVQRAIDRVTLRVRGYIRSCQRNQLGADGTIPDELRSAALAILLEDLATTIPASGVTLDEGRQRRITEAKMELKMVAKCELLIGQPTTPATDSPAVDEGGYGGETYVSFSDIR